MAAAINSIDTVTTPRRIPVAHVVAASAIAALFVGQISIGTNLVFAGLVAVYAALAWTTMSVLGGVFSLGGFIVAVCSTIHVLFGQVLKTILHETPDRDLQAPVPTMLACVLMMAGFLAAAIILKLMRYESWRSAVPPKIDGTRLRLMGTLLYSVAAVSMLFLMLSAGSRSFQSGGIFGIAKVVSNSALLGISLLVAAAILEKKRIFTPLMTAVIAFQLFCATFDASRQDFLGAILIAAMTAIFFKHKFRWYEIIIFVVALTFYQSTFSPYALYARSEIRDQGFAERVQKSTGLLGRFITDKSLYTRRNDREEALRTDDQRRVFYYRTIPKNKSLERITLLPTIDSIIANSLESEPMGAETTIWGFQLATPSILNRDKPLISSTNLIAHKGRGLVNPTDHGTQISMGFTPDAFVSYGWSGIFFCSLVLSFAVVAAYRLVFGQMLLFNAAAIGVMFKTSMVYTEGTMATTIANLITFVPVICTAFLALLWIANSMVKRRERDTMTMVRPIHQA